MDLAHRDRLRRRHRLHGGGVDRQIAPGFAIDTDVVDHFALRFGNHGALSKCLVGLAHGFDPIGMFGRDIMRLQRVVVQIKQLPRRVAGGEAARHQHAA